MQFELKPDPLLTPITIAMLYADQCVCVCLCVPIYKCTCSTHTQSAFLASLCTLCLSSVIMTLMSQQPSVKK